MLKPSSSKKINCQIQMAKCEIVFCFFFRQLFSLIFLLKFNIFHAPNGSLAGISLHSGKWRFIVIPNDYWHQSSRVLHTNIMSPPFGSTPCCGFLLERFRKSGGYVPSRCFTNFVGKITINIWYWCVSLPFQQCFPTKYGGFAIVMLVNPRAKQTCGGSFLRFKGLPLTGVTKYGTHCHRCCGPDPLLQSFWWSSLRHTMWWLWGRPWVANLEQETEQHLPV